MGFIAASHMYGFIDALHMYIICKARCHLRLLVLTTASGSAVSYIVFSDAAPVIQLGCLALLQVRYFQYCCKSDSFSMAAS